METKHLPEFARIKDLSKIIGIPVSTIWKLIREDGFPKPIKASPRISLFNVADAIAWITGRPMRPDYKPSEEDNGKESTAD